MKSDKMIYWLDTGIFTATVMFSVGYKYEEIIAYCKKKKAIGWDIAISQDSDRRLIESGNAFGLKRTLENTKTGKTVTYFFIILTEQFDFSDWAMVTLAHECLHICQFMLPDMLDRDREYEAEAYFHSYLMTECLKRLRGK